MLALCNLLVYNGVTGKGRGNAKPGRNKLLDTNVKKGKHRHSVSPLRLQQDSC